MSKKGGPFSPVKPSKVDGQRAIRTVIYKDVLRTIIKGAIEVECPDDWDSDYFLNMLLFQGYFLVSDSVVGVNPFPCSFQGLNYMGLPTRAIVAVPNLREFTKRLGKDAVLIYLERTPDKSYRNLSSIVSMYAEKLASIDGGIDVNLMNAKMAYVIEAETKAQADTIKDIFDRITEGEPIVVYAKELLANGGLKAFFGNVKQTYIVDLLQDSKRTILNEFLTLIGVNNANTDKKERLITSEAESNNVELDCNIGYWQYMLDKQCNKVNSMFPGTELKISFKYYGMQTGVNNATRQSTSSMGSSTAENKPVR